MHPPTSIVVKPFGSCGGVNSDCEVLTIQNQESLSKFVEKAESILVTSGAP